MLSSDDQLLAEFRARFPMERIINELAAELGTPLRSGTWRPGGNGDWWIDVHVDGQRVTCFIGDVSVEDYVADTNTAEELREIEDIIKERLRGQLL